MSGHSQTDPATGNTSTPPIQRLRNEATLIAYFRSGWAFSIPYLIAYLLYAWLRWPVNPASNGEIMAKGLSESGIHPTLSPTHPLVPCLLHLYWVLHLIHAFLGAIALRSWWTSLPPPSAEQPLGSYLLDRFWPVTPWLLLALIFWIPNIYIEWPSDPWEHLRRINEWHILDQVTAHSSWKKSSYFLPYSLTGHTKGAAELSWLNLYYTSVCLLLSWQYFRLARAVDLSERASFIFVLLNALTFGNSIFSFYRYYGLSSSIFAQLGAVGLTRIVLEFVKKRLPSNQTIHRRPQISALSFQVFSVACLFVLITFNHVQGLGIAGLCIGAIIIWRLLEWKRSIGWWLLGAAIIPSIATVLWCSRHPAIDAVYRAGGWLNAWYGFNFFSWSSPTADRSMQILGLFGLLNLGCGFLLLRRNHVAAWLTLAPIIALSLPIFALPLANAFATKSTGTIITFHRLLFAIPAVMATVVVGSSILRRTTNTDSPSTARESMLRAPGLNFVVLLLALTALTTVTAEQSGLNRLYHVLLRTPADLTLSQTIASVSSPGSPVSENHTSPVIGPLGIGFALRAMGHQSIDGAASHTPGTLNIQSEILYRIIGYGDAKVPTILVVPPYTALVTPRSTAAFLSKHWPPLFVAYEYSATPEFALAAQQRGLVEVNDGPNRYFIYLPDKKTTARQ